MPKPRSAPSLIPAPPGGQPGQNAPRWPIAGSSNAPSGPFDPLKVAVNDVGGAFLPFLRSQSDQVTKGVDMAAAGLPLLGNIGALLKRYLATAHGVEPGLAHTVAEGFTQHIGEHLGIHEPSAPASLGAGAAGPDKSLYDEAGRYIGPAPKVDPAYEAHVASSRNKNVLPTRGNKADPQELGYQGALRSLVSTAKGK